MLTRKLYLNSLLIFFCIYFSNSTVLHADTTKDLFFRAESSYAKLLKNEKKQKYRHNWLLCIDKFQAVYRKSPNGKWAAAGLYRSGVLYWELYKRSYKKADKKEAIDSFERIIKRFPNSRYRAKADGALKKLSNKGTESVRDVSGAGKRKTRKVREEQCRI